MEQLGEISSSTAGAAPSSTGRPCDLDNCGVIVAIYQGKPELEVQPDWALDPYYSPAPYFDGGLDAWDDPMGPMDDEGYVVETAPGLWQIEVQMNTGSTRVIRQDYQPLLQVGDPVLVEGESIRLWN
jgi:hypothetical protein